MRSDEVIFARHFGTGLDNEWLLLWSNALFTRHINTRDKYYQNRQAIEYDCFCKKSARSNLYLMNVWNSRPETGRECNTIFKFKQVMKCHDIVMISIKALARRGKWYYISVSDIYNGKGNISEIINHRLRRYARISISSGLEIEAPWISYNLRAL